MMGKDFNLPVSPLMVGKGNPAVSGVNFNVFLLADDIVEAAEAMLQQGYHLENIDAVDVTEGLLVTYHYAHFTKSGRIAHRVMVSRDEAKIPSISSVFQGADWHERECRDFHGLEFSGHPNLLPLLLDPEIPCGVLLKDDSSRKALKEVLSPGEIVFKADGFNLFDKEEPAPEQAEGQEQ
ncbi:NADH-quinone oxidoreductase subunit C [Maridesulfovibrio sp.]|uniref:NADH-quinone oxidoreductase subunit C n=1 Tax=Maridesulfovibrio sp. TaxID=2795000 RepID=UPI002A18825D|nr:NADH-quinone oxidoreductase subunit C [Maridesulfovibrio sp.]